MFLFNIFFVCDFFYSLLSIFGLLVLPMMLQSVDHSWTLNMKKIELVSLKNFSV